MVALQPKRVVYKLTTDLLSNCLLSYVVFLDGNKNITMSAVLCVHLAN